MAGPYIGTLVMKGVRSGRKYTLSTYTITALAVGAYVRCDWNFPAAAASPDGFTVPELVDCIDFIIGGAPTGGMIEFTSDGQRTNIVMECVNYTAALGFDGRLNGILPRLQPLKTYRLICDVATI